MSDKQIICIECRNPFTWTERDQLFFSVSKFDPPKRCRPCKAQMKAAKGASAHIADPGLSWINQDGIVRFVQSVEDHKGFKRDPRLVFAHIVEEAGELSKALWQLEKVSRSPLEECRIAPDVVRELIDIIFLACYMADIFGEDVNEYVPNRMAEIRAEYGMK